MSLCQFSDIISLSNKEISEEILKTETEIFNLRFKKATRQTFKLHKLKTKKCRLAQLNTLLKIRVKKKEINVINQSITN